MLASICFDWISATTQNRPKTAKISLKKNLTTLLLKSCSVSISGVRKFDLINYTYITTAAICPYDMMSDDLWMKIQPAELNKKKIDDHGILQKQKLQRKKEKRKIEDKKKMKEKNRHRPVIDSMIVICLLLSETSLFTTCLPC